MSAERFKPLLTVSVFHTPCCMLFVDPNSAMMLNSSSIYSIKPPTHLIELLVCLLAIAQHRGLVTDF